MRTQFSNAIRGVHQEHLSSLEDKAVLHRGLSKRIFWEVPCLHQAWEKAKLSLKKWEEKAHLMGGTVCTGLESTARLWGRESQGLAGALQAGGEAVGGKLEGM